MKKLLAIFLTMALIVSPAFVCALSETTNPVAVVFPESVGFEDYDAKQKVSEENPVSEDFTENVNAFSYLLAAKTLADMKENVTFSPLSLYLSLIHIYGRQRRTNAAGNRRPLPVRVRSV